MLLEMIVLIGLVGEIPNTTNSALELSSEPAYHFPPASRCEIVPLEVRKNRVLAGVQIGGAPERQFLVDNGFYDTAISPDLINEVGFSASGEKLANSSRHRRVPHTLGTVERLRFGDLTFENAPVMTSPLIKQFSREIKKRIHGVIGMRLMSSFLTTVDLARERLVLRPLDAAAREELLSRPGTAVLQFKPHPWKKTSTHLFTVEIEIDGKKVDAFVDMGYHGGILTTLRPNELGTWRNQPRESFDVAIAGFRGRGVRVWARDVSIGGLEGGPTALTYFRAAGAPSFAILGVDFIKRFEVTFDFERRELILHRSSSD